MRIYNSISEGMAEETNDEKVEMSTEVKLLGMTFANPLLPAAGPLTEGYENLLSLESLGLGGLVTKTVSVTGAEVRKPCIVARGNMVHNCELWSEYDLGYWHDTLEKLKPQMKRPLGVSAGYTPSELAIVIPKLEPFADFFEISTHYNKASLEEMVRAVTSMTQKPVFIKMSPHVEDDLSFVETVLKAGGAGIVAFNSFGPGLVVDLKHRSVLIGNQEGNTWVSGPAIKPFALNRIANIRKHFPKVPLIGCGGVQNATDALEMILAGADLVQLLSSALTEGRIIYGRIAESLQTTMRENGINSIAELRNTSISFTPSGRGAYPRITEACTGCMKCVKVCPFGAYQTGKPPIFNRDRCIRCGLCESTCLFNAIKGVLSV